MRTIDNKLLLALLVLIWVIAILHFFAEYDYWYWRYRWFDIPMHYLGGVWVGLAAAWLRYHSRYLRKSEGPPTRPLIVILCGGVVFGMLWELYEFLVWTIGSAGLPVGYVPDTALDLVMDTLGALTAYGVYRLVLKSRQVMSYESAISTPNA